MRKRAKRFKWFPILPTVINSGTIPDNHVTWYDIQTTLGLDSLVGRKFISAINIVDDETEDPGTNASQVTSLRDQVEGQEYFCERVVGKVWGGLAQDTEAATWLRVIVAMGLAVMPYDDNETISLGSDDIDPLLAGNSSNSWMWRNTWTLYNNLNGTYNGDLIVGPTNIANVGPEYGTVDVRSVRRIHRQERLTLVCSVHLMDSTMNSEDNANVQFAWGYDLRLLGAMRKAVGGSSYI